MLIPGSIFASEPAQLGRNTDGDMYYRNLLKQ